MINQVSKIQVRSGLQQNLPLLAQGEFGWAIDTQRLFIGNGNVTNGAPFEGNTEILTVASSVVKPSANLPVTGTPAGTINGSNQVFTIPVAPYPNTLIVWRNFPLIPNVGYTVTTNTISGSSTITFSEPPQIGDHLYFQCWIA